jgi:hypothetical protein
MRLSLSVVKMILRLGGGIVRDIMISAGKHFLKTVPVAVDIKVDQNWVSEDPVVIIAQDGLEGGYGHPLLSSA